MLNRLTQHTPLTRIVAVAVAVAVATPVPFIVSDTSAASTAAGPAAGTVHVYIVNTSLSPTAPNSILITGAFSDHGHAKHGVWHLTKGTITVNNSAFGAVNSPSFGTSYPASCSSTGVATGTEPIVSGTGAYAAIKGSLTATVTEADQGSLLKSGKCDESKTAPEVAHDLIVIGSGKVSF